MANTTTGFYQQDGAWHVDGVALTDIAARYPTPCYVYSESTLINAYHHIKGAFCHSQPTICYAVKANDNLSVLAVLAGLGANFDIVSGGELARVMAAGGAAADIIFSGVGKTTAEIDTALTVGVGCFNVESEQELKCIEQRAAAQNAVTPIALRITYDIDGDTHRYLTTGLSGGKFGIAAEDGRALAKYTTTSASLNFLGYSCHIGSQITDEKIYLRLAAAVAAQVKLTEENGVAVGFVDMGGGFAVDDQRLNPPPPQFPRYDKTLAELFAGKKIAIEPGRSIVASAGALLTRVEYIKQSGDKTIWVTDIGMNDLLRPALYDAKLPVLAVVDNAQADSFGDVVGPICESADIIARERRLSVGVGELLMVANAGAYGMVMASNYNARPRPVAVMASDKTTRVIRRAETIDDLLALER